MGTGIYTFHDDLLNNPVRFRFLRHFSGLTLPKILNPSNITAETINETAVNIDHTISDFSDIRLPIIRRAAAANMIGTGISLKFILIPRKKLRIFALFAEGASVIAETMHRIRRIMLNAAEI